MRYEKYTRDGLVAVLYSPGFGAGWSTWNGTNDNQEAFVFDAEIVQAVLDGDRDLAAEIALRKYGQGDEYACVIGADDLQVAWLPVGTRFEIHEYDGSESIRNFDVVGYMVA